MKFGDSEVFLLHLDTGKLIGCPVSERSRHRLGGPGKRRVIVQKEAYQGLSFTVTRASGEQAKAAAVVQLMESTMRNYDQKYVCGYRHIHVHEQSRAQSTTIDREQRRKKEEPHTMQQIKIHTNLSGLEK